MDGHEWVQIPSGRPIVPRCCHFYIYFNHYKFNLNKFQFQLKEVSAYSVQNVHYFPFTCTDVPFGKRNTVDALVSDHLRNLKVVVTRVSHLQEHALISDQMEKQLWWMVAYESFRNSLIIHKDKTEEILFLFNECLYLI